MKSSRESTLNNGNKIEQRQGRQEGNKLKKAIELIGEENLRSLIDMHMHTAFHDEDKKLKAAAISFLIDRFVPRKANIPHRTHIKIELAPMNSHENINKNEIMIMDFICNGILSIEEGKEMMGLTKQRRDTIEATDIVKKMNEMDQRMKEKGI